MLSIENNSARYSALINQTINDYGLGLNEIYQAIYNQKDEIVKKLQNANGSLYGKIHFIFAVALSKYYYTTYAGCYEITNKNTNAIYIGESINMMGRFTEHISKLYNHKHHCKNLQKAFDETNDISNFIIKPLYIIPIIAVDRQILKHETLYLEACFYLVSRSKKIEIYNTLNPYVALKKNQVKLEGYNIDCKKVLHLIYQDKYHILPDNIASLVRKDLKDYIDVTDKMTYSEKICVKAESMRISQMQLEEQVEYTKVLLQKETPLYRLKEILNDFVDLGILPERYDSYKIREILVKNNLIYIGEVNNTIATEYAIDNELYHLSKIIHQKHTITYQYYLSQECKDLLYNIFKNYEDKDSLKYQDCSYEK
jgi:hypothetical protein